jgi:uncharacterized protein YcfL
MKTSTILLALATVSTAVLPACNTANTARPTGNMRADGSVGFEQIVTNGWLNYKANIVGVREATVSGNIRKVAVEVYSDQLTTQQFSYRFEWQDDNGMPVASPTGQLTSVTIKPKETITLTSVGPSPAATKWRLTFLDKQY